MQKRVVRGFIAGFIILSMGALFWVAGFHKVFTISFINAGLIMVAFSTFYAFRSEALVQDERTRHISALSLSYSWFVTYMMIAALAWVDLFELLPLTVPLVLMIVMLTQAFSTIVFRLILNRRDA